MRNNSSFNLEKIQEVTSPIEKFEGKIISLEKIFARCVETKIKITKNLQDSTIFNGIKVISQSFNNLYTDLKEFSHINANKFLVFQDKLTEKYKNSFKQSLNGLNLKTREIGLRLIENKQILKVPKHSTIIPSLSSNQWIELIKSLQENSLFLTIIKKIEKYLEVEELRLITKKKNKAQHNAEVLEELDREKSDSNLTGLNNYLKYPKEVFEIRRRREKRKKLEDLQVRPELKIEITEDVSKKIENFKSKLQSEFKEKYLIQKDETQDPITLIRDIKKKKKKYNEYLKKIKDKK